MFPAAPIDRKKLNAGHPDETPFIKAIQKKAVIFTTPVSSFSAEELGTRRNLPSASVRAFHLLVKSPRKNLSKTVLAALPTYLMGVFIPAAHGDVLSDWPDHKIKNYARADFMKAMREQPAELDTAPILLTTGSRSLYDEQTLGYFLTSRRLSVMDPAQVQAILARAPI